MSLHTLANHLQTAGRGEDKVLVHMTPGEVHGLQSLAMAHGGSLTTNPQTGLPEAGFLSSILPMLAGAALTATGVGAPMAAMMVGGATAVATGSLKNGILAGLGAYGGAGLGAGISGAAGAAGAASAAAPAMISAGAMPGVVGGMGALAPAAGAAGAATAAGAVPAGLAAATQPALGGMAMPIASAAPVAPVSAGAGAGQLAYSGGIAPPQLTTAQIAQQQAVAQQAAQTAPSAAIEAAKSKGMFSNMDFSKLMNPDFMKENKGNYLAAMAPFLMEEERKKKEAQAASQMQLGGTSIYNPTPRAPGGSSERLYFADGGLANLPVENMSQQNTVGANTSYPMANIKPYGYAVPKNNPISQNVFKPDSYQNVDPYTGEQKLASGGIVALASGGLGSVAGKTPAKGAPAKAAPAAVAAAAKPKSAYTEPTSDVKGENLTALSKAYDASIKTQKAEMDKAKAALDAAKKTKKPSLIESAQDVYNKQANEYTQAQEYKNAGITAFKTETKRGSDLQARGYETKAAQASGDVSSIQAKIDAIKKNATITGMGTTSLSDSQRKQIKALEGELSMAKQGKVVYDPKTGNYVPEKVTPTYSKLTSAPSLDSAVKILEEKDIRAVFEEMAGRAPTKTEIDKYLGGKSSQAALAKAITDPKKGLAELQVAQKFTDDDLNQQAQYYWGREMTPGELKYYKNPANKVTSFNSLRNALTSSNAYLENLNKINQTAFTSAQKQALAEEEGPASMEQIASYYQDVFGKQPTMEELIRFKESGLNISALQDQIKGSEQYQQNLIKPLVPTINTPAISQDQINAYRAQQIVPQAAAAPQPSPYMPTGPNVAQYNPFAVQPKSTIEGALPYADISQRLGLTNLYSQLGEPGLTGTKSEYGLPAAPSGLTASAQNIFGFDKYPTVEEALKAAQAAQAAQQAPTGMASGGIAGYNLGGYSDGGRLLRGPGDGVSDSIPASIGDRQPARLADGEFVVPARIVSELGNGSTEAGARKLYAMMDRVQRARRNTVGKGKVAVNSRAEKMLPA